VEGGKNRYASDIDSSRVEIVESWGLSASKGSKMLCKLTQAHSNSHTHTHSQLPRHVIVPFWHLLSPFSTSPFSAFWRYFRFGVLFRFSFEFALNFRYFSVLRCLFWFRSLPIFCPLIFVVIIFWGTGKGDRFLGGGFFGFVFIWGPFYGASSSGCPPPLLPLPAFPPRTHTRTFLRLKLLLLFGFRPSSFAVATPAYTLFYYIKCFTATSPLFSPFSLFASPFSARLSLPPSQSQSLPRPASLPPSTSLSCLLLLPVLN